MKKIHRLLAMLMAAIMALSLITTAFAEPTIDPAKNASLSIYKYDITTASAEGAWDAESYVSTGLHDDTVIDKLSKYAIQGVEFTYLRIADITMNNELADGQRQVGVLYGFDSSDRSTAVLSAISLTAADAHKTDNGINYFTSDVLNNKLAAALAANATNVKNALEAAVKNGGVAMTETDATGHTSASNMEQGLYLVVETRVPENVTSTCNPFFVSLPMTTIDGAAWNYDVTVYPKNQTGNPDLEKTAREAKNSTGKNTGTLTDIKDGYHETNKRWSRTIFVPEDGGHRHTFLIGSHPAVLDGFVSDYRAELARLHLFGAEHCEPNSGEQDFTGRVLVLSPDTLRESCWQPENQLWLAFSGFGCRPHVRGHSVLCTCLGDGETTRWNRSEFLGIIRDECLPDWAAEKLAELRQNQDAPTMGKMTM